VGVSKFHIFSNSLEIFLFRHQYIVTAVTAASAVIIMVIAIKILLSAKQQTIVRQRTNMIAGIRLFVGNRDGLSDHLGYLCYCALLGHRPSGDGLGTPRNGLSFLLDVLRDRDAGSLTRLKDHPQATQFRSKAVIVRSPEMENLIVEVHDLIALADDCGCSSMVNGRITDLYSESKKSVPSLRGPGSSGTIA
jgi:hypothetical protein